MRYVCHQVQMMRLWLRWKYVHFQVLVVHCTNLSDKIVEMWTVYSWQLGSSQPRPPPFQTGIIAKLLKSLLTGNGFGSVRCFSISSANLSFNISSRKLKLKSWIQLSQYYRCQTQRPEVFEARKPFQIYQSALGLVWTAVSFRGMLLHWL